MTRLMAAILFAATAVALSTAPAEAKKYRHHHRATVSYSDDATIIGGRPSGCPHRFCGCGLRLYLGEDDKRLNLAANWLRYYHGSRTIVVWPHHVALVEEMLGGGLARLRDYNSGGGLSRVHVRSIRGARIVNGSAQLASR